MAHIVSQTQQPPQPPLPYSHPSYQHYPPPFYPYPPPPPHHQPPYPHPHPQYPYQPSPYAHHPPTDHYPPAPPAPPPPQQLQPPPPPNSTANLPSQAAGRPKRLRWVHPTAGAGNSPQAAEQDGETPTATFARHANTEDDDTKLVRCALRWNFVRVPGVSHTLFWHDVSRSFERIRGRPYATCKRRLDALERTWRDIFASRDAPGGLRGNNNTDLARTMRAWMAFRDDEERQKKEKENDVNALDVRRRRLHELETERLGLTEVCRYDTRVVTEDEEIGLQGVETSERQSADGDGSNPILVEDEPDQTVLDPLEDLEPPKQNEQSNAAGQIAPILELLRKRQREEREEADIRREEQVLLNKRLALMEEQMQMLSELITQHNPPPTSPSPRGHMGTNVSTVTAAGREPRSETAATSQGHSVIQIDDAPAEDALEEPTNAPLEPGNKAVPTDTDTDTHIADEVADVVGQEDVRQEDANVDDRTVDKAADVPGDTPDERTNVLLEPGTKAVPTNTDTDTHIADEVAEALGPEDADVGERTLDEAADVPGDASMDDSAEMPSASSAGLEARMTISATSTQNGIAQTMSKSAPGNPTANTHEAMDDDEAMESPRTTETIDD